MGEVRRQELQRHGDLERSLDSLLSVGNSSIGPLQGAAERSTAAGLRFLQGRYLTFRFSQECRIVDGPW